MLPRVLSWSATYGCCWIYSIIGLYPLTSAAARYHVTKINGCRAGQRNNASNSSHAAGKKVIAQGAGGHFQLIEDTAYTLAILMSDDTMLLSRLWLR